MKKYDAGLEHFYEALKLFTDILPSNNPMIADCIKNLATAYAHQGENELALKYYDECLWRYKEKFSISHSCIGEIYFNIGLAFESTKAYNLAFSFLRKSLKIFRENLDNLNVTKTLETISLFEKKLTN